MLTVKDLMTKNPITVSPNTLLREVIAIMKAKNIRQLPVLDQERLVGMVTDRDVRLAMNSPFIDELIGLKVISKLTASNCMTPAPMSVTADSSAYKTAAILKQYKFGALPVVEGERLVGIITVTDFLTYVARLGEEN